MVLAPAVILLSHAVSADASATIDLMAEENKDKACQYVEKYHIVEGSGCDSDTDILGGKVSFQNIIETWILPDLINFLGKNAGISLV